MALSEKEKHIPYQVDQTSTDGTLTTYNIITFLLVFKNSSSFYYYFFLIEKLVTKDNTQYTEFTLDRVNLKRKVLTVVAFQLHEEVWQTSLDTKQS